MARRFQEITEVYRQEIAALARSVADRYVGSLTDVLRFAVPPRHARAEAGVLTALEKVGGSPPNPRPEPPADPGGWARIHGGEALLRRLAAGEAPRAAWTHLGSPGSARSMIALAAGGTGAIFLTMSTIASVSKRDFSGMGKFLFIGLIVVLLAAVANIFFQIPALSLTVSTTFRRCRFSTAPPTAIVPKKP